MDCAGKIRSEKVVNRQLDINETLTPEKFLEDEKMFQSSDRIDYILKCIDKDGMEIIDIGGASGFFLNEIINKSAYSIVASNLDVDDFYIDKQVSPDIKFINNSILNSELKDESYDIVTFRHVLHHLVSDNIKHTFENQKFALKEMLRIVKKGGYIIFEEEVNNVKLFSRIIFYLSKFASKFKLNVKYYDAGKVVVAFLTKNDIKLILSVLSYNFKFTLSMFKYFKWKMPLKWKVTLLMASVGAMFIVIKKQ
jgi:ubiquinone/menaquinone biosynthesis C-methylase UbiE